MTIIPLVSVIVATYNWKHERLSKSIDSVLNQTFKDFELIIINDASTNDIERTILEYVKKDKRVIYLKNDKNLQLTRTLNKWIEYSKWKYITRIDDDDIWINKDKLEKQVKFMEENPDYWLCWAWEIINIDEDWNTINKVKMRLPDAEIRNSILQSNQFAHSSIMMRKSILDEVWIYNPKYNKAEDYELWCRIGIKSKFSNLKDIGLKYRINSNWISTKNYFYQRKLWLKICILYHKYYPNFFKAIILRIWDLLLPTTVSKKLLNFLKLKWILA